MPKPSISKINMFDSGSEHDGTEINFDSVIRQELEYYQVIKTLDDVEYHNGIPVVKHV